MIQYNFNKIEDEEMQDNFDTESGYPDYDGIDNGERIVLDDPETLELDDDEKELPEETEVPVSKNVISALRAELKKTEDKRLKLCFRHRGVYYEGVPLLEIDPNKFVFSMLDPNTDEPTGKMSSFKISEISVV